MFLNKLFGSERACCEWAKCCVSRDIRIDLLVAHHAQIFDWVRVRKHTPSKYRGGGQVFRVGIEAHYLWLLAVCWQWETCSSQRILSACLAWSADLRVHWEGRERSSANSIFFTAKHCERTLCPISLCCQCCSSNWKTAGGRGGTLSQTVSHQKAADLSPSNSVFISFIQVFKDYWQVWFLRRWSHILLLGMESWNIVWTSHIWFGGVSTKTRLFHTCLKRDCPPIFSEL